jgi:hypothetical protein
VRRAERDKRDEIVRTARAHQGYRALALRNSIYGTDVGHPGYSWNGAFVETVFRECGLRAETASTVSYLADASIKARSSVFPRAVGDIVVYAFPVADDHFGQPAIGIVTDISEYRKSGEFLAVEGETASGKSRGDQTANGVFERRRFETDVLIFIRPDFRVPRPAVTDTVIPNGKRPWLRLSQIQSGKRHKSVELVQRALAETVGLREVDRGWYDPKTASALAAYQRRQGFAGQQANGLPNQGILEDLGRETGVFDVRT